MQSISIGNQSFASVREKCCFYIDKTDFIREWWESNDVVTLLTRPRRFGKTFNMDMLNCFFSNQYAERADLFEGLSIWQDEKYQTLQGTYPVIFLSFASVKAGTYENSRIQIIQAIIELYNNFDYLRESSFLNDSEKNYFRQIQDGFTMNDGVLAGTLHNLSAFLYKHHKKKVLILLDEYDTPMQEAYIAGFWEEIVALIRSLFNATFKTNSFLERAIMTGITRVSKESIFSDLNNLRIVTITSEKYEHAFGFTEDEVFQALDEFGLSEKKDDVKNWYDGFTFGKAADIYNPWSITNFLDIRKFDTYWANTSANGLIGTLIREGDIRTKQAMEDLLEGKPLLAELDEQIVFSQLDEDETAIWSLMLASGYLKQIAVKETPEGVWQYEMVLTNREVRIMFRNMIKKWFRRKGAFAYNEFIRAFLQDDKKAMNHYMNKIALHTFSYFDTGKEPSGQEPERLASCCDRMGAANGSSLCGSANLQCEADASQFYHGFVLGLIVELRDRYHITSNRESGFGRYDVMLEPISAEDLAYVLEFKVYDKDDEETLQDTVAAAHRQIEEKKYDANLVARGIKKESIRHYGFAFRGKEILIA